MTPRETDMGGPDRSFRTTIWSDVLAAGDPSHPAYKEHLDRLLKTYWKPAYAYIRLSFRTSVEEAKDLVQEFFARLIQKDFWSNLDPKVGSFRSYLRRALKNFMINAKASEAVRQKHTPTFSMDAAPGELERLGPASTNETPEQAYNREWFRCVMAAALDHLKDHLVRQGKEIYWKVFDTYCLKPTKDDGMRRSTVFGGAQPAGPTYKSVADQLNLKESEVRNYLTFSRNTLREIVRWQIREYVDSDDDVDGELKEAAGS